MTARIDPADYDISPDNARIQIWSEFYGQIPAPDRLRRPVYVEKNQSLRNKMVSPDVMDDTLGFNQLVFGPGRAFAISASARATNAPATSAQTGKELRTTPDNRHFIIESVRYTSIRAGLQALGVSKTRKASIQPREKTAYASTPRPFPAKRADAQPPLKNPSSAAAESGKLNRTELAKIVPRKLTGMLIDYLITIGGDINTPVVYSGDETVFVDSLTYWNGPVTIEGGCVFKYPLYENTIYVNNSLTLLTASYRPAFFTAADDTSVGSALSTSIWYGYTGTVAGSSYGDIDLWFYFGTASNLHNLVFRYAYQAIQVDCYWDGPDMLLSHSQFLDCSIGIGTDGSGTPIFLNNCLFSGVGTPLSESDGYGHVWNLCNCTFDNSYQVLSPGFDNNTHLFATNCIFANTSDDAGTTDYGTGDHNGFYNHTGFGANQVSSTSQPFQTVGAGSHYLSDRSPFRNAGVRAPSLAVERWRSSKVTSLTLSITISGFVPMNPNFPNGALSKNFPPATWLVRTTKIFMFDCGVFPNASRSFFLV